MKTAALHLAALGLRVHVLYGIVEGICTCGQGARCKSTGKHPVVSGFLKSATTDPDVISSWDFRGRNIGVVPGDEFTILDFDGVEGADLLQRMARELPPLPDDTPICRTGSGGIHVYIAGSSPSKTRLLPGFDIRGVGGQAVVPPSDHYLGGVYTWLNPPRGTIPEAPEWLAVARGQIPAALQPTERLTMKDLETLKGRWSDIIKAITKGEPFAVEGARDKTATSLAGALASRWPHGDVDSIVELVSPSILAMGGITVEKFAGSIRRFQVLQAQEREQRPQIPLTDQIEAMSNAGIAALASKADELGLYTRGGALTRVHPPEHLPEGVLRSESPPIFEPVDVANLTAFLSSAAQWLGSKGGTYPPPPVVQRILKRGEWPGIPHAERIVHGLALRPDGTIFRGGGHDPVTGIISLGPLDDTPLPSVQEALDALLDLVGDFPFAAPEHRSAWLSSILTSVGQTVFRGPSPLFLVDANVRSSGKTLAAETAILVASGKSPSRGSIGQDNEEDRKQITALARDGATHILIDNIVGSFGTPKLCEALTLHDGSWSDRILGKSQTWSGSFKATWWATANNAQLAADVARRVCHIRLNSPHEKPELRTDIKIPSLLAHVSAERTWYYRCAVTILHHYLMDGAPKVALAPWGGYEGWSDLVRQALVWCGLPDPADTRRGLEVSDEDQILVELLLKGLSEVKESPFTPTYLEELCYTNVKDLGKYKDLKEAFESCVQRGPLPTAQSIGKLMMRFKDRTAGGLCLRRLPGGRSLWMVEVVK